MHLHWEWEQAPEKKKSPSVQDTTIAVPKTGICEKSLALSRHNKSPPLCAHSSVKWLFPSAKCVVVQPTLQGLTMTSTNSSLSLTACESCHTVQLTLLQSCLPWAYIKGIEVLNCCPILKKKKRKEKKKRKKKKSLPLLFSAPKSHLQICLIHIKKWNCIS